MSRKLAPYEPRPVDLAWASDLIRILVEGGIIGTTFGAYRINKAKQTITLVAPTDPLRLQWADAAGRLGLDLAPVKEAVDYDKAGYVGCVATYAQLAAGLAVAALLLGRANVSRRAGRA